MSRRNHWDRAYQTKKPDEVSWYRTHLETSLRLIEHAAKDTSAAIIDVGGGESTLVDDLLDRGYEDITVLDLSPTALEVTRVRLGERASRVHWLEGDATRVELPAARFDVWHDRAVFHFLTQDEDRVAYVAQVARSVKPGGHVIVATFGPEGPLRCSGLEVVRYDAEGLHHEFGESFALMEHQTETHQTPLGKEQQFVYCYCRRQGR
jgi:ubiquinone/menaquinone biosynthesis C-methylase UbiE